MRLLQIVPLHDSYRVFLKELTEALRQAGHEVLTLCCIGEGNAVVYREEETDCQHFTLPRGSDPRAHWESSRALASVVNEFQPDVVHAHFSSAILSAALARSRCDVPAKWIGTYQGLQFPCSHGFRKLLLRTAESYSASRMDTAIVLTEDDASALRKASAKASVMVQKSAGFGCADRFLDTPFPKASEREQIRNQFGLTADHVVFVFIGRLVNFKGFHTAARAFMKAHQTRPEIRWIVIGELDPLHSSGLTDDEFEEFEKHPAIHWLRTQNDVLPLLDVSDAMLFPSTREGMPVSVMEALARRIPVMTNPIRGCRELIQDKVNGLFFETEFG